MDATPKYPATAFIAAVLRVFGAVGLIMGVVLGALQMLESKYGFLLGMVTIVSAVFVAILYFAIGELLSMVRDMAINSFRSAAPAGLAAHEIERAMSNAIRDNAPSPVDEPPSLHPGPMGTRTPAMPLPDGSRQVVCNQCGKVIRVSASSKFKPGDTARCPTCQALIVV